MKSKVKCFRIFFKMFQMQIRTLVGRNRRLVPRGQEIKTPFTCSLSTVVHRSTHFKTLQEADVAEFKRILSGDSGTIFNESSMLHAVDSRPESEALLQPYNIDWMKKYKGKSKLVLRPQTASQVAAILKYCSSQRLAVVPQGGNTGLVGGGVPVFDEIIIQMGRMNQIRSFDDKSGVVTCDAGVILEQLDDWLAERGYI